MLKGIMPGAVGGLCGTLAMNEAQRAWTYAADGHAPDSAAGKHDARDWQERSEGRNSNEIAAQAIATRVTGRPLDREGLAVAAAATHFAFGAAMGALYGAYVDGRDRPFTSPRGAWRRAARGVGFGLAVWLFADEIAMPLLGLSEPTTRRPLEHHLQSVAAHIVFGMMAELGRTISS